MAPLNHYLGHLVAELSQERPDRTIHTAFYIHTDGVIVGEFNPYHTVSWEGQDEADSIIHLKDD